MKLARIGRCGEERLAILDANNRYRDVSGHFPDLTSSLLADPAPLAGIDPESLPQIGDPERVGPCIGSVGKFICVGLNYSDHAAESGMQVPDEPIIFMKATSAICGPNDDVLIPPGSTRTDWEVELGVVIGQQARHVAREDALSHVAGYCVVNDISEREYQLERGGQWVKGKSYDTFGPIGPWFVTRDEIEDPQDLEMWLSVDRKEFQRGSTATMVFGVAELVSHISQFMTLNPGDIISTGTPPGVGMGQRPDPVYLRPGQTMRLCIEGLGQQEQITRAAALPPTMADV